MTADVDYNSDAIFPEKPIDAGTLHSQAGLDDWVPSVARN